MICFVFYESGLGLKQNSDLINRIKTYPGWAKLDDTHFLINIFYDTTTEDVDEAKQQAIESVRNQLKEVCDPKDYLFVGETGDHFAWSGYGARLRQWLETQSKIHSEEDLDESYNVKLTTKQNKTNH